MAPHSSTLAWKIPWMEEPGGLQSMGPLRVGCDSVTSLSLFTFMHWRRKWQPYSSVLAWRIPGMAEPDGLLSMGSHRVRHNWSDLAAAAAFIRRRKWKKIDNTKCCKDVKQLELPHTAYRKAEDSFGPTNFISRQGLRWIAHARTPKVCTEKCAWWH